MIPPGASERQRLEIVQFRRLRLASMLEATTLILLAGAAAPLKHLAGWPEAASILEPVHGLVFLAYLWTVVETVSGGGWSRGEVARLVAIAFVPFGGFTNGGFLKRKAAAFASHAAG